MDNEDIDQNDQEEKPIAEPMMSGSSDSILASLYRSIMIDLGITVFRFNSLMNDYVTHSHSRFTETDIDKSSVRGNLKRALLSDKLSWKVFCTGLKFLHIWKFDIIINAHHTNGQVTVHKKTVQMSLPPSVPQYVQGIKNDKEDKL